MTTNQPRAGLHHGIDLLLAIDSRK
jgi:hypothetical protein